MESTGVTDVWRLPYGGLESPAKSAPGKARTAARLPVQSGAGSARRAGGCDLGTGSMRRRCTGLCAYAVASPKTGPLLCATAHTWRGFVTQHGADSRADFRRLFVEQHTSRPQACLDCFELRLIHEKRSRGDQA